MRARRNLRAALHAYVQGHDRVRDREGKLGEPDAGSHPPIEFGGAPAPPSFGVPVPERLEFHRGPATWRDRRRPPETSSDG